MYKRSSRALSALLTACLIMTAFAAVLPTKAYADTNRPDFSYITDVYNDDGTLGLTAAQAQNLAAYFCEQLPLYPETIDVYDYTDNEGSNMTAIFNVYLEVAENSECGIFYLSGGTWGAPPYYQGTKPKWYIKPNRLDISAPQTEYASVIAELDKMTAPVHDDWTDAEKAMYLHDFIAVDFDYDFTYAVHSVYEFLQESHEGVCDAYASLYSYLLNRLGIPCVKVTSKDNVHAWNIVEIDGTWYYVDVTHDDSYHNGHPGLLSKGYFLNSSEDHVAARGDGWDESEWTTYCGMTMDMFSIAPTDSYSGFWDGSQTPIWPYKDGWLYTSYSNRTISVNYYNRSTEETTTLTTVSGTWGFVGNFSVPAIADDDVVFFTTNNKIYGYYNGKIDVIASSTASIYGLKISGDKLIYYTSDLPTSKSTSHALDLSTCVDKIKQIVTVTYISDGEVIYQTVVDSGTYGNSIKIDPLENKDDAFFVAWAADEAGMAPFDFNQQITEDTTIYAKYMYCDVESANTSLLDNIKLTYRVTADPLFTQANGKITFFVDGQKDAEYSFDDSNASGENTYDFSVTVAARQMDSVITAEVTTAFTQGKIYIPEYSVNKNLEDLSGIAGNSDELAAMIDATEAFGACSNAYLDGNSSTKTNKIKNLIKNINITEKTQGEFTSSRTDDISGLEFSGATLLLRSATTVRYYFTADNPNNADINTLMAKYKFSLQNAPDGTSMSYGVKEKMENVFYVEVNGIDPSQLGTKFGLLVENSAGTEKQSIEYSPCCYMFSMYNKYKNNANYADFVDLLKSMYLYYTCAVELENAA